MKTTLLKIQQVPSRYTDKVPWMRKKEESTDKVFNRIVEMDTAAIEPLIEVLADTSSTRIWSACEKKYFTIGQLAMLLIDRIESIPFATVTRMQFDFYECGYFPDELLEYVREHGAMFQRQYRAYYYSKERRERVYTVLRNKQH